MRTVFLGTPESAVPSLEALAAATEVVAVLTQPDRPRGRSKRPQPTPVKLAAERMGIDVVQPVRSAEISGILGGMGVVDAAVVVAYGMLIRPDALVIPRLGFVNVHFSLLPRWRGAAPVQRAIQHRDRHTGVTIMSLDEGLDTGPILASRSFPIGVEDTAGELLTVLAASGADLLIPTLTALAGGRVVATAQDDAAATHAPKIDAADRRVPIDAPADDVVAAVHALSPRPGGWVEHDGRRVKLLRARPTAATATGEPGTLSVADDRLLMDCTDRRIELVEVQPEGKRPMDGAAWARGLQSEPGALR